MTSKERLASVRQGVSEWPKQDLRDNILWMANEFAQMETQLQKLRSLLWLYRECSDCRGEGKLRVVRSSVDVLQDGPCVTCGGDGMNPFVQRLLNAVK